MIQKEITIEIMTNGEGYYNITHKIDDFVATSGIKAGVLTVFVQHTSAGITIQENADSDVLDDLNTFFNRISPKERRLYRHSSEGADDMPAHISSSLVGVSVSIPVSKSRMKLGTWQAVYLCEFRERGHNRRIALHLIGE